MGKKKQPKREPTAEQGQTLLKWLQSRKRRHQEPQKPINNDKEADQRNDDQVESARRTKKIKKVKNGKSTESKSKDKSKRSKEVKQKQQESGDVGQDENQDSKHSKQDQDQNQANMQKLQIEADKQAEPIPEVEQQQIMVVQDQKATTKKGKGRKKKAKHSRKVLKKQILSPLDYEFKYPQLFTNQDLQSVELIFDKYKPDQLDRYRKGHQEAVQVEYQADYYEHYPVEQKPKAVKMPSEPLPDGRRYEVPIKVCTCCNFFGKRHLCSHNLCSKPCPIEHRKTKIRDRYFERYKHRPKTDDFDDEEEEEL